VASGASTAHIAGMFNVDFVVKQGFTNTGASRRRYLSAFWAIFGVGQYFDNGHFVFLYKAVSSKALDILARQSFLNAVIHAVGCKSFGGLCQGLRGIFYRLRILR
jgi:hypothetical protein